MSKRVNVELVADRLVEATSIHSPCRPSIHTPVNVKMDDTMTVFLRPAAIFFHNLGMPVVHCHPRLRSLTLFHVLHGLNVS